MSRRPGAPRGTSNGNSSGNVHQRRARRQWLLDIFGDGKTARCALCAPEANCIVDIVTLTVDRIVPGCKGGRYTRDNIQPACSASNSKKGGALRRDPESLWVGQWSDFGQPLIDSRKGAP